MTQVGNFHSLTSGYCESQDFQVKFLTGKAFYYIIFYYTKQYDGKTAKDCKNNVSTLIIKGLLLEKCLLDQKLT